LARLKEFYYSGNNEQQKIGERVSLRQSADKGSIAASIPTDDSTAQEETSA